MSDSVTHPSSFNDANAQVAQFVALVNSHDGEHATRALLTNVSDMPPEDLIDIAQGLLNRGYTGPAVLLLFDANRRFPDSLEIVYWLAFALNACGELAPAESWLRRLAAVIPGNAPVAMLLVQVLQEQGRYAAAVEVLQAFAATPACRGEIALDTARALDDCGATAAAYSLCTHALSQGDPEPELEVEAGVCAMTLGHFDVAREHLLTAARSPHTAIAARALHALANTRRYVDRTDGDFALFEAALARSATSDDAALTSLQFALAKASDDIGDVAAAAELLRRANAAASAHAPWSGDHWSSLVARRLASPATGNGHTVNLDETEGFSPVFIVGMLRSGTTLLSSLLARRSDVRARGELAVIENLFNRLNGTGRLDDPIALARARDAYVAHARRDDHAVRWFVDKQPLNFLYVDFIRRLFPNARFVHCRRDHCDTALSVWMQYFSGTAAGFAYQWRDIAAVLDGADTLMRHWGKHFPDAILSVDYEALVRDPDATMAAIERHLGMPASSPAQEGAAPESGIATASMWQARQPVYQDSVGRSRLYRPLIPELDAIGHAHPSTRSGDE